MPEVKIDLPLLRCYCLSLLASRDYSEWELTQKLTAKGASPDMISTLLADCKAKGWQSDARFAENYSHYRSQKGVGPRKLAYELRNKGIDAELIDETLDEGSWLAQAKIALQKRFGTVAPVNINERNKRIRFLLQRGFTMPTIQPLFAKSHRNEEDHEISDQ